MKPKCLILVAGITAALSCSAFGQQDEKLGRLSFPTSCDPKVQAEFERGVAMIHSYWFIYARRTFEGVLQQDPTCAIAYWGVAVDYLGNTLAVAPTRAEAEAAWAALEKARATGAKTQRERDWIEALSAYFRDHDKTPVDARLAAYNKAMGQMVQRYPDHAADFSVYAHLQLAQDAKAKAMTEKSLATADRGCCARAASGHAAAPGMPVVGFLSSGSSDRYPGALCARTR
jgi:hypothetical protein